MTHECLNVGVGDNDSVATPMAFGCLNVDCFRLHGVDVVCDVQHLPFRTMAFRDVYCFHVLEHTENPAKGLAELVRVASRLVEVEVPHRLSRMAKSQRWKKGNVALYHLCSFRCSWFHKCLKRFRRCVKILYEFPRDLHIHVWVYLQEESYGP